jgi:Galactose oxidase, central domain/Kelch motif
MEPGLAAALYTAETAVQGAVVSGLAIARSTVPLNARFYRLPSPSPGLKRSSHTLNVIKGKAYILGGDGDTVGRDGDAAMHVVTLPTDLVLRDTDYQKILAVAKPVKPVFDVEGGVEKTLPSNAQIVRHSENVPAARAGHSASAIGERIYVFGGSRVTGSSDPTAPPNSPLEEDGKVYVFDTIDKTWEVLVPNQQGCRDGIPRPRNYASSSSTTHPFPIKEGGHKNVDDLMTEEAKLSLVSARQGEDFTATYDQQPEGYGTLFLHGGYDSDWNLLRDLWAFDVASRIWSRWPNLPTSDAGAGEGNICCIESRIWRSGDDFGKIAYFEVVRNQFDDMSGKGELGVSPKTGKWEIHTFGVKPGQEELEEKVEKKMGGKPTGTESLFPAQRKRSGFLPVTTGQGRDYLLLFMGEKGPHEFVDDIWSFQIASEKGSAAALKDTLRAKIGKETGVEQWAKANVVESNKEDGALEFPRGLSRFGSSPTGDSIGDVLIWGGIGPDGTSGDGWIMTLE